MCGITAVVGKEAINKALNVLVSQESRGTSSCGVAYLDNTGEISIYKKCVAPKEFSKDKTALNIQARVLIGHNRMPSVGRDISEKNAHPFKSCDGKYALVHNGTVREVTDGIKKLLIAKGHNIEGETDSEVITHLYEELAEATKNDIKAIDKLQDFVKPNGNAILVLSKEGIIYGFGCAVKIALVDNSIIVGSEKNSFIEGYKDQSIEICTPENNTVFKIDSTTTPIKVTFYGDYKKELTKIEESKGFLSNYEYSEVIVCRDNHTQTHFRNTTRTQYKTCPECGSQMEKIDDGITPFWSCMDEDCGYEEKIEEEETTPDFTKKKYCKSCNKEIEMFPSLVGTKPYWCVLCGEFKPEEDVYSREVKDTTNFPCPQCHKGHNYLPEFQGWFQCMVCKYKLKLSDYKRYLKNRKKKEHQEEKPTKESPMMHRMEKGDWVRVRAKSEEGEYGKIINRDNNKIKVLLESGSTADYEPKDLEYLPNGKTQKALDYIN